MSYDVYDGGGDGDGDGSGGDDFLLHLWFVEAMLQINVVVNVTLHGLCHGNTSDGGGCGCSSDSKVDPCFYHLHLGDCR